MSGRRRGGAPSPRPRVRRIPDNARYDRGTFHIVADGFRFTNEIRFEIARQLLEDTEVPLAQIAAALGYSEASAFTRAFRRWSGQTPTAWRAEGHPG